MFYQLVGIGEGKKGEKMNIVYTQRGKKKWKKRGEKMHLAVGGGKGEKKGQGSFEKRLMLELNH